MPGVVKGGEEVVKEVVAKGGQDEHQAPLVQVPHCVQLVIGKISRKIIWDRVQLILER